MKFGKVERPELVDFTIPKDHLDTEVILSGSKHDDPIEVYVGCAKWNAKTLRTFIQGVPR